MGLAFALAFAFVLLSLARDPLRALGASEVEAPALYPAAEAPPAERALDTSEADGVPALLPPLPLPLTLGTSPALTLLTSEADLAPGVPALLPFRLPLTLGTSPS